MNSNQEEQPKLSKRFWAVFLSGATAVVLALAGILTAFTSAVISAIIGDTQRLAISMCIILGCILLLAFMGDKWTSDLQRLLAVPTASERGENK